MKILLHPGLHKTGTTSIQMFLRSALGSDEPKRVWYPMTTILNPGHSALPSNLRVAHLEEKGLQIMRDYVDRATSAGTETLIISAEGISRLQSNTLVKMRDSLRGHFMQLIFTLAPYKARAISLWQEGIKHKLWKPIGDTRNILNPRYEPRVVGRVTEALAPDDCIAIIGRKSNPPDWLINTFLDAGGLREHVNESGKKLNYSINVNRSFGWIEIEIIRHINMCIKSLKSSGIDFDDGFVKKRITSCLTEARWRERVPKVPIEFPDSWTTLIREQALRAKSDIESLLESGRIKVIGDIQSLVEGI